MNVDRPTISTSHFRPLSARAIQGAVIAAVMLGIYCTLGGMPNNAGLNTILVPMVVIPFSGAIGGATFYFTDVIRSKGPVWKAFSNSLCISIYFFLVVMAFTISLS